jgi:hypothetical protein
MNEIYSSNVFSLFISSTQVNQKISVFSSIDNLKTDTGSSSRQTMVESSVAIDNENPQTNSPTRRTTSMTNVVSTGGY